MKTIRILPLAVGALLVGATLALAAPPAVRTIAGGRLTINVGDDTSFQVFDSDVPPDAQNNALFSPVCGSGDTADTGVLLSVGGIVYGPNFATHPCGTFAPAFTPWTPISLSPVTGSGSSADPYKVVLVADAGATGLRLTETITHVAGSGAFRPTLSITNTGAAASVDVYLATHMFLAIQYVYPILLHGAPGGWAAIKVGAPTPACAPEGYYALLPAADRYTGQSYGDMWNEIMTGGLSNTMQGGCSFEGIATQWAARTVASGVTLTLSPSGPVEFIRADPFQVAAVPVLSAKGLAAMVAGIAIAALLTIRAARS
ncbi:MAG TPA: hypothetical protein VGK26_03720 [Thermoanaerobaculia bacterium]|jgi:hypothetical protein